MSARVIVALTTCPDEAVAQAVATALVRERLAGCINRLPGLRSTYFWDGRLQDEAEILLIMKTTTDRVEALEQRLRELHPYELPEFVVLPPVSGNEQYLDWIRRQVGS
jgi:periplasmic divalent cation tolerance protein